MFGLADENCFYVSSERLFNPRLTDHPFVYQPGLHYRKIKLMFQPFDYMKPHYLERCELSGKHYLVSQTYERGRNEIGAEGKEPVLMNRYDDRGLAEIHYKAIPQTDRYRFIPDMENEVHLKKITEMIQPESKYVVYAN